MKRFHDKVAEAPEGHGADPRYRPGRRPPQRCPHAASSRRSQRRRPATSRPARPRQKAAQALADKIENMSASDKQQLSQGLQNAANQAGHDPQKQRPICKTPPPPPPKDDFQSDSPKSMKDAADRMGQQQADRAMSPQDSRQSTPCPKIDRMASSGMSAGEQASQPPSGGDQNQSGQQSGNSGQNGDQPNGGQNGNGQGQQSAQEMVSPAMARANSPVKAPVPNRPTARDKAAPHRPATVPPTSNNAATAPATKTPAPPSAARAPLSASMIKNKSKTAVPRNASPEKCTSLGPAAGTSQVLGVGDKAIPKLSPTATNCPATT